MKPRTSPETKALVLWALEHNVRVAKSPKARSFAQGQLESYKRSLEQEREPRQFDNPMERFANKLNA